MNTIIRKIAWSNIEGYVKHNQFDRELQTKNIDWFKGDQLEYDKKKDVLNCPIGDEMKRIGSSTRILANGFKQTLTKYQSKKCNGCPL